MSTTILCIIGLVLDIIGGYLIYKFGLPETNLGGGDYYVSEDFDEKKADIKSRYYNAMSKMGIRLIFLGFLVQLLYYSMPMLISFINFIH